MSAESLYQALRDTIDDQLELDDGLSTFELIGVVRLIEGELVAAAVEPGDDEEEEDEG
jgi:hypothetical protein